MIEQYPEHVKLLAVASQTQAAGEFLEWLGEQGFDIVHRESRAPCLEGPSDWVSKWAGIDTAALEREKRAMCDSLQLMKEK